MDSDNYELIFLDELGQDGLILGDIIIKCQVANSLMKVIIESDGRKIFEKNKSLVKCDSFVVINRINSQIAQFYWCAKCFFIYFNGWQPISFPPAILSILSYKDFPEIPLTIFKCCLGNCILSVAEKALMRSLEGFMISSFCWLNDYFYFALECRNKVIKWLPGSDWIGVIHTNIPNKHRPFLVKIARIKEKECVIMGKQWDAFATWHIQLDHWKLSRIGIYNALVYNKFEMKHKHIHALLEKQGVPTKYQLSVNEDRKRQGLSYVNIKECVLVHSGLTRGDFVDRAYDVLRDACFEMTGAMLPRDVALVIIGELW